MSNDYKISVRALVEFVMRRGSIDNRFQAASKAIEGIKGHQYVQSAYGSDDESEVTLNYDYRDDDIHIEIEGRADGILKENNKIIIDEIKTTTRDLLLIDENYNPLHFEQAKCYGYIYGVDNELDTIDVQVTYYNIDTQNTRSLRKTYALDELKESFFTLINEYKKWCMADANWIEERNDSIKEFQFPFSEYRRGQRELAVRVYKAILEKSKCFAQAPTGIGKTISTLFPAVKAIGEGITTKIFYLTAKTITREAAESAVKLMKDKNLKIKSVTLTAKDKVCFMDETNCNPEYCPYAENYFDKINNVVMEVRNKYNFFDRETINKISKQYKICPFEFALELTLICDIVICDYNYLFDPSVYLKRFFDIKNTDYTFLIDEAHNLIDRGRDMYSAYLFEDKVKVCKKIIKTKSRRISNAIKEIELYFSEKSMDLSKERNKIIIQKEAPKDLKEILKVFINACDEYLARNNEENDEFLECYFEAHTFVSIMDYYDENYVTVFKEKDKSIIIKLYCVNPSKLLQARMNIGRASIIFSATLIPLKFYKEMYGYNEKDYIVNLMSPFDHNNRLLMIADNLSTTFKKREETSMEIVDYIKNCVNAQKGNYLVFFPSYDYMNMIYDKYITKDTESNVHIQGRDMEEEDKEDFISIFKEGLDKTNVAFSVLGSHFSEGIDLAYDKLIGVIIVGVGMPKLGIDRDIIRDNINSLNNNEKINYRNDKGFDYAYVYPGMIKVLQAAGRCIRTKDDKGVILLIDKRYGNKTYSDLFPIDWRYNYKVKNSSDINKRCLEFWNK